MFYYFNFDGSDIYLDTREYDNSLIDSTVLDSVYYTLDRGTYNVKLDLFISDHSDFTVASCSDSVVLNTTEPIFLFNHVFKTYDDFKEFCSVRFFYDFPSVSTPSQLPSLNGDFQSFKDGEKVVCYPTTTEYTVVRSYFISVDDTDLTIVYDLISSDGKKHSTPHMYVAKKE